jgi:hypothetical protein
MIINISDHKDTKFLSCNNTLSVEIKFHWQIIAFFLLYRWHSYINNVLLFTLGYILWPMPLDARALNYSCFASFQ